MAEAVLICSPKISYIQQSHCNCGYYLVVWIKSCITIPHRIWYLFWFTTQARGRELGGEVRFGDFQLAFPSMRSLTPHAAAAAAKSLQSCPTLCNPLDSSPPGSPIPRILQARTLQWVAISFSNAWKWKVKVKSLSRARLCGLQPTRLLCPWIFQARELEWGAIAFSTELLGGLN